MSSETPSLDGDLEALRRTIQCAFSHWDADLDSMSTDSRARYEADIAAAESRIRTTVRALQAEIADRRDAEQALCEKIDALTTERDAAIAKAEWREMVWSAGQALSNIAYNLSQIDAIPAMQRDSLRAGYRLWDEANAKANAAVRSQEDSANG